MLQVEKGFEASVCGAATWGANPEKDCGLVGPGETCDPRQLSTNTVLAHRNDLADYAKWLAGHAQQHDGTTNALKAYLEHMIAERKLAAATVRRRIAGGTGIANQLSLVLSP